jgi:hypothetical protein
MSHNFITVALSCRDGQSQQRLLIEYGSLNLAFVTLNYLHYAWFSPGTFHSPVSTLTLTLRTHIITTVHTTQSHNSPLSTITLTLRTHTITTVHTTQSLNSTPSLTKTSVCVSLKNINQEPSQQVCVLYTENSGLVFGFEILYVVTWSEKEPEHNYTV